MTAAPDVVVTKEVDDSIHTPGEAVTYTITFTNNGNADATNVTATDDLTESLAHGTLGSCSPDCTVTNGVANISIPSIPAGSSVVVTIVINLDASGWPDGTTIVRNSVVATDTNCPAGSTDPTCSTSFQVPVADMALVKNVCRDNAGAPLAPCTTTSLEVFAGETVWWQDPR